MGTRARRFKTCFKLVISKIFNFICSFLEVHSVKFVAFSIMCYCCYSVNALHMIAVVMLVMCLLFGTSALQFSFTFIGPYLGILFLSKMVYQTKFFPSLNNTVNCSHVDANFSTIIGNTILDPIWWGFESLTKHSKLISHYKGYILVLVVMSLQAVIRARQKIMRIDKDLPQDVPLVMYAETTRIKADENLKNCLKFLLNYGYYKFGVEIALSYCVFVIGYREDAFSILYATWVLILILPKRTTLSIIWPFFLTTVLFSVLWQYIMAVGLSENSCFVYPWADQEALIKWLFLPNFKWRPNSSNTLVDFVLLLLLQRQQTVFELERRFGNKHAGGSNKEDYLTYYTEDFVNPYPDHTVKIRSWIVFFKKIFMTSFFRITLAVLLWNGAVNVNILSLGFLVIAFVFFWADYSFCLMNIKHILRWWNTVLVFTTLIIITKPVLKFVGCICGKELQQYLSYFVGIFWKECCKMKSNKHTHEFNWDVICFFCVIIQRRHFKSCYFVHEVKDLSRIHSLQEVGARIIDKLHNLRIKEFQEQERKTLEKIKKNMNRIKAWQKRMQGKHYVEPTSHEIAIYSGDYFMFDDVYMEESRLTSPSSEELTGKKNKALPSDESGMKRQSSVDDDSVGEEEAEEEEGGERREKERSGFYKFLVKVMVFFIRLLKKFSTEYRYMEFVVGKERKRLQDEGIINLDTVFYERTKFSFDNEDKEKYYKMTLQKLLVVLFRSIIDFLMSKTELFCYLTIFLHTLLNPSFISLSLPIMVLLWGSLTSVRPTTTFWTVLIAYTEMLMVIRGLFRNSVFPWNSAEKKESRLDFPSLLLGTNKEKTFSVAADLMLLLVLFVHRYKLKILGMWNRSHEEQTYPPEDLKVYKELPPEGPKNLKSRMYKTKKLIDKEESPDPTLSNMRMAFWKCTSRATAKVVYKGYKSKAVVSMKEIEGEILVTHEGRRLRPTQVHISELSEAEPQGNIVLRVFNSDIPLETRTLVCRLCWLQHLSPLRKFFLQMVVRDWRISADFYTAMFIFQFITFFTIFFGYPSFVYPLEVQSDEYFSITKNQVPPLYLFAVISHFLVIVIDRVLYLRKCLIGKLILQFILVILVHTWMFIIIPIITEEFFNRLATRQFYYLISCFYFLMSAYQLRVGYPLRVQGHFLSRKYGYFNYYAFVLLRFLPFFNQIRTLLDYLCTHTSLSMMQWIKMESIFDTVFEAKCSRRADIYHPAARGEECPTFAKYVPGVFSFLALVIIIWLPFIVFAVFHTVGQPNLPEEATLKVEIGSYGNLYTSTASFNDIFSFSERQYRHLQQIYKYSKKLWTFLSLYDSRDVGVLKFRFEPTQPWSIIPKELRKINETVQDLRTTITIYVVIIVQRKAKSQIVMKARGNTEIVLKPGDKSRKDLGEAFLNFNTTVRLDHVLPKFVHVTNEGRVLPQAGFMSPQDVTCRNVTISLQSDGQVLWWKLEELADDPNEERISKISHQNQNAIVIYTFNEKSIPKMLLEFRRKGIIGLYISVVFVSWTFVRRIMMRYPVLMFNELPNPDPVLQLCKDIYLARENHEFALEEDLYAKLLFLFRSPETMIKVTRLTETQVTVQR